MNEGITTTKNNNYLRRKGDKRIMDFKFDEIPETKVVKSNGHKPPIKENPFLEFLEMEVPDAMLLDGHDNALLGYVQRYGMDPVACYDYHKVIENLMKTFEEGESDQERYDMAIEWFQYNIIGAWLGEKTPCFVVGPEK